MGTKLGLAACAAILIAGCGDNIKGGSTDGPPQIDGPPIIDSPPTPDGTPDAAPDAAVTSFTGQLVVTEAAINGIPQLGQGVQIDISFSEVDDSTLIFDDTPGQPTGCKVRQYTPAQAADIGLDEGTVALTVGDGGPVFPDCNFIPTLGYTCIGLTGTGGVIALVDAINGVWSLTDTEITNAAQQVGRWVTIAGSANGHDGAHPIVGSAANTVLFINPNPAALPETLPAAATFVTIAGVGPIPGTGDPGFLEDDDTLTVALTPGGDNDFEAFSQTFSAGSGGIGDDFTLDTASQGQISSIPTDGSTFSIGCDGAGGTCNNALGSIVSITTTDGSIAGLPPYVMPPPATVSYNVRCSQIGLGTIDIPAAVSAFIMGSGATRIQTTFLRGNVIFGGNAGDPPASYTILAGHAMVGFTTP
jgi:hypothetical protein